MIQSPNKPKQSQNLQISSQDYNKVMLLALLLSGLVLAHCKCPDHVADQLELISQPLQCFRKLYDYKKIDSELLTRVVSDRLQIYKRMMQEVSMSDQKYLQTSPVLKWAQSYSQIFISFKLSHRQDSPTCSDLKTQSFSTEQIEQTSGDISFQASKNQSQNDSVFSYRGQCYFTTQKFLFSLSINFQGLLKKLILRKEGLGLYTLIGDKAEAKIWVQPFNEYKKAAIWSQLRIKHSSDMDKYFQQAEALTDSRKTTTKRRSKKRAKQHQQGSKYHVINQESQTTYYHNRLKYLSQLIEVAYLYEKIKAAKQNTDKQ